MKGWKIVSRDPLIRERTFDGATVQIERQEYDASATGSPFTLWVARLGNASHACTKFWYAELAAVRLVATAIRRENTE